MGIRIYGIKSNKIYKPDYLEENIDKLFEVLKELLGDDEILKIKIEGVSNDGEKYTIVVENTEGEDS